LHAGAVLLPSLSPVLQGAIVLGFGGAIAISPCCVKRFLRLCWSLPATSWNEECWTEVWSELCRGIEHLRSSGDCGSTVSRLTLGDALDRPELIERIGVDDDSHRIVANRAGCGELTRHGFGRHRNEGAGAPSAHPQLGGGCRETNRRTQLGAFVSEPVESLALGGNLTVETVETELTLGELGVEHRCAEEPEEHQRPRRTSE